jgi:two-component system, NtrC family, C4-dicarboxylate transport sensor histidine kinase DctB
MLSKMTFARFFIVITVVLFISTLLFYLLFLRTQEEIVTNFEQTVVAEVEDVAHNITQYLLNKNETQSLYAVLKEDKEQIKAFEAFLSTFQTSKIQNIFVVDKPQKNSPLFRVLLDGTREKEGKFEFGEMFEPANESWDEILLSQKPKVIYQANRVTSLWATFLYPVVQKNGEVVILALDFSNKHYQQVVSSLDGLEFFSKAMVTFLMFIFMLMIIVARLDIKREALKQKAQRELVELNSTLEKRIEGEVEKNRQKDQQLMHQSRLASMGEMISMIAHQWRQPLSAISSTAQGLTLKLSLNKFDPELFTCKLNDVNHYAQHLSQTIDDFRQFFKPSHETREVVLEEVITKALGIIQTSIENKNIEVRCEFGANETIRTHPNELMQVVLNLIKNAEDILLENEVDNPWIGIATQKADATLCITVSDNGGGIPPSVLPRIFEPYFSTKTKKDGTGLGLYMSHKIVEEHCGGKLYASNTKEGAVFVIELPRNVGKG